MQTMDVTVRLQALSGVWETCGADRAIGVDPESVTLTANPWGSDKATFDLHRSVIALWPDLGAFTPCEVEIGGMVVWKGRINETPLRFAEWVVNVQCEGWQYHLDDDTYARVYVHSKLTDWKDGRSGLETNLAAWTSAPQVQTGSGAISITWPQGVATNGRAGVVLDLGQFTQAKRIVIDWSITASSGGARAFYAGVGADPYDKSTELSTIWSAAGASSGTYSHTFATPQRYVYLVHDANTHTPGADETLKITRVLVFSDTAYESGNASVLKASTVETPETPNKGVIPDALERATMLLSSDHSQIAATSFSIPDLALEKQQTPREVIEAVNAYHNWITKLDMIERMVFAPHPTSPLLEIGAWSGADIEDASANSGDEIHNRAIAEATGADGSPMVVERSASQQPGVSPIAISSPAATNPSFTPAGTEGWSVVGGGATLTRDTTAGKFNSAPASGKLTTNAYVGELRATFSGTFKKGTQYLVSFMRLCEPPVSIYVTLGVPGDIGITGPESVPAGGSFKLTTVTWTPKEDHTGVTLSIFANSNPSEKASLWVDDVVVQQIAPTLIDRRTFRRTKVIQINSAITATEGNQLADTFLRGHTTTPFKGSAKISPGGARTVLGGQPVHPSRLLTRAQELIRLSHMTDPDTGGIGRDGTIANVTYTHKDQTAQVDLDENRTNFDALLNRLAVVQGTNG